MGVKAAGGHRQRQADETKRQVAEAARSLFAERGYVATTVIAVSERSGVPEQTIYSAFGSKRRILQRITAQWMLDSDTAVLAEESHRAPDPAARLRLLARINRRQLEVGADVVAIYQEAARVDAEMSQALQAIMASRESEIRRLLATLTGDLKQGVSLGRALDIALAAMVLDVYRTLVTERGWTPRRYETWLGDLLVSQLLS